MEYRAPYFSYTMSLQTINTANIRKIMNKAMMLHLLFVFVGVDGIIVSLAFAYVIQRSVESHCAQGIKKGPKIML